MADSDPVERLAEIDTLLRAELAVEPSRAFVPRVRERIRSERSRISWLSAWRIAPLTAAATLLIAAGLAYWNTADTATPRTLATVAAATPPSATRSPGPGTNHRLPSAQPRVPGADSRPPTTASRVPKTEFRRPNSESRVPSTKHRLPSHRVSSPEVLIDAARQRQALLSFIAMARLGQVPAEPFATTPPAAAIVDQVQIIAVDDVAVSAIVPGGVLFFEFERK